MATRPNTIGILGLVLASSFGPALAGDPNGNPLAQVAPDRADASREARQAAPPIADAPLRFQQIEVKDDSRYVGGVAFTCLIPEGWKYDGGIEWRQDILEPCCVRLHIFDPNSRAEVNAYPDIRFSWPQRQGWGSPRVGQVVLGARTEPPLEATDAMRQWVIPERLGNLPADAKIVSCVDYPEYAKYAEVQLHFSDPNAAANPPKFSGAQALIEYTENGALVQQKVLCAVASGSVMGTTYWSPCLIASVKAEKGKLDGVVPVLTSIAHSVKVNEDWAIKVTILRQYLVDQRTAWLNHETVAMDQFCTAQRRRLTADFNSNMAQSHQRFEKNMAAMDQQTESMDKILTGVQTFSNPMTGRSMELPSNSQHVYYNNLNNTVQIGGIKPKDWTELQPR